MHSLPDERLIEIFQKDMNGQGKTALDHLYVRYARRMLNFFYFNMHNDNEKAKDLLHDLFVRIIENKNKIDKGKSFQAWIYRTASNMCIDEFRSEKTARKYENHVIANGRLYEDGDETVRELRRSINALEQEQRALIVLRFKMKLSIKEIAEIYECPEGTVKSRLFHATRELSKAFNR
jgi:RNA polymerase sigma-70 factor, ECF subfamily